MRGLLCLTTRHCLADFSFFAMKTFVCDSFVMFSFADFMYNGTDLPCTAHEADRLEQFSQPHP